METSSYVESHALHIAFPFWKLNHSLALYLLNFLCTWSSLKSVITDSAEFQAKKQNYLWTFVAAEVK